MVKIKTNGPHTTALAMGAVFAPKSEPGALDGTASQCTACNFVGKTSLSAREAERLTWAHIDWMKKEGR